MNVSIIVSLEFQMKSSALHSISSNDRKHMYFWTYWKKNVMSWTNKHFAFKGVEFDDKLIKELKQKGRKFIFLLDILFFFSLFPPYPSHNVLIAAIFFRKK